MCNAAISLFPPTLQFHKSGNDENDTYFKIFKQTAIPVQKRVSVSVHTLNRYRQLPVCMSFKVMENTHHDAYMISMKLYTIRAFSSTNISEHTP